MAVFNFPIRRDDHVEILWRLHQPAREIVDDKLLVLYFRMQRRGLLDDFSKQSIRLAQHVVLRGAGELALATGAFTFDRELTGELRDPARRALGDHFDRVDTALGGVERCAQNFAHQL